MSRKRLLTLLGAGALLLAGCVPQVALPPPVTTTGPFTGATKVGQGFGTCTAPSTATMTAWAPTYTIIGVYIGGNSRGCSQPNLTPRGSARSSARAGGLLPIWVGPQAPTGCTSTTFSHTVSADPGTASAQGVQEASAAIAAADALSMGSGSPIYYDMEAYSRNSTCSTAVRTFLNAWVQTLHNSHYVAGYYSSAGSGIADVVATVSQGLPYQVPDQIWSAHWLNQPCSPAPTSTSDPSYIPDAYWSGHQRHRQWCGGHTETHPAGGVTINIDNDISDGLVVGQ